MAQQFGGLKANDAKRLKDLEKENCTLKRLLADAELAKAAVTEIAGELLSPQRGQAPVAHLIRVMGVSERFACRGQRAARHDTATPADGEAGQAIRTPRYAAGCAWAKNHPRRGFPNAYHDAHAPGLAREPHEAPAPVTRGRPAGPAEAATPAPAHVHDTEPAARPRPEHGLGTRVPARRHNWPPVPDHHHLLEPGPGPRRDHRLEAGPPPGAQFARLPDTHGPRRRSGERQRAVGFARTYLQAGPARRLSPPMPDFAHAGGDHRRAGHRRAEFERRLTAITDEDWGRPTPCTEWNVAQVVNHIVGHEYRYADTLATNNSQYYLASRDEDFLGEDPHGSWPRGVALLDEAIAGLDSLDTTINFLLPLPARDVLLVRVFEAAVHTWDVSRAIGFDDRIDERLTILTYPLMERLIHVPATQAFFAPPQDTLPSTATTQDRLLHLAGRTP